MSESTTLESLANVPYTYDHVPRLRELLPQDAGRPGVKYAQVCSSNAKSAQDDGWGPVAGAKLFTINGPKGHCDMLLACQGNPIQGASSQEGARMMVLDHDIYRLTGLWLGALPDELQEEFDTDGKVEDSADTSVTEPSTSLEDKIAGIKAKD